MAEAKKKLMGEKINRKNIINKKNWCVWWYAACFLLLGLIDQRQGSARGEIQMLFADLVGGVVFLLLLPSLRKEFWSTGLFKVAGSVLLVALVLFHFMTKNNLLYWEQWSAVALSLACGIVLALYIIWDRKVIFEEWKILKAGFGIVAGMLLCMILSVNESHWPGVYLIVFGCFYLIGIPKELKQKFVLGMLAGLAGWFVIQQSIAFGFRPYDFVRYKGLYSGITPNGVFYMIAFCTFSGIWFWLEYKNCKKMWRVLYFILSAGAGSLMLLTGVRSSCMGVIAGAFAGYLLLDVFIRKSFKHWLLQGIMLGVCIVLLFPVAYGCVRYFPTLLHHPVWFEGEYREWESVHSYDLADSDRYITFEKAVNENVGRILGTFGIELKLEDGKLHLLTPLSKRVDAAEAASPGSSPENPFRLENETAVDPGRATIYAYYTMHLNLKGHKTAEGGFYYSPTVFFGHAHNMFLQIAYDHGIIAGTLFLIWNIWCLIRLIRRKDITGIIGAMFLIAILTYGMTEQAVNSGQITLSLLFLLYYWGLEERHKKCVKKQPEA